MKITIYELLGLIKDGKAPKKIKYQSEELVFNLEWNNYVCCDHDLTSLFNEYNINTLGFLNSEVEIIDNEEYEKIIKLNPIINCKTLDEVNETLFAFEYKINQIIDEINKGG